MRKLSLFMLMAVGLLISGNLRADNVCKNVETGEAYESLQAAFDAATSGQTVQMIADDVKEEGVSAEETYLCNLSGNKDIILDLNGKKIYRLRDVKSHYSIINVNAGSKLTINDSSNGSGIMEVKVTANDNAFAISISTIISSGEIVINSGKIICTKQAQGAYYAIDSQNNAKLTINGGYLFCNTTVVRMYPMKNQTNEFYMTDGLLEGAYGVYAQKVGTTKFTVTGGEIRVAEGKWVYENETNNGGTTFDGDEITISGGLFNGFLDLGAIWGGAKEGQQKISISGGRFTCHNAIRTTRGETKFAKGGIYFFTEGTIENEIISMPITFMKDENGKDMCISGDGYTKWYGDLATKEGWETLGYTLKPTTFEKYDGDSYYVVKITKATKDYSQFLTLIADGYMAVDISGQNDGKGGTYPEKTVEIKQVEEVILSGTQDWTPDMTDGTKAVTIAEGANITIPTNTTVEAYSVNVPTGSTLNVENGATLIVGAGGVTTATGEEVISINIGSNDGSGAIKISPDAPAGKAQPRVRIKLTTIAHQDAQGNSHWQYFARPTGMTPESFTVVEAAGADKHYIRGYIGSTDSYENITGPSQFANYEGYAITNNSTNGGVVYQFEGKLNVNQNAEIKFKNNGFSLMGNSYLAPVSVEGLFKGIIEGVTAPEAPATAPVAFKAPMEEGGNAVEWTIWIYNCANERFEQTNLLQAMTKKKQLQPMQGFFMKLREGTSQIAAIDYVGAVWNNNAQAGPILAPAYNENEMAAASIVVSANGNADQIDLFEGAEFDNTFNNGADASKLMNLQGMFNLYAQTEAGTLSCVASDNIEGTILTFQANNASEYELSFNGVENMNYSLIDLFNGEIIEMNESNVYKFNAVPNSTEARFQIVEGYKAPTAMEKVNNVKAAKGIYSVTGAYIGEVKNFNALPAGIYIVNGQQIVK